MENSIFLNYYLHSVQKEGGGVDGVSMKLHPLVLTFSKKKKKNYLIVCQISTHLYLYELAMLNIPKGFNLYLITMNMVIPKMLPVQCNDG